MSKVQSNGIDIEYEEFGDPQAPATHREIASR